MKLVSVVALLVIGTLSFGFSPPDNPDRYAEFRPPMQSIYASLIPAIGFLLRDDARMTKEEKANIEAGLQSLAENSAAIERLAQKSDKGHQILAGELATNAKSAYSQFKAGHSAQARFFLSDVVNACFNCHTSRGSDSDSRFVGNFNKDIQWEKFEPIAKARFLALSRQFESASKEYERLLRSNDISLDELINRDPFLEYMILEIRVRNDPGAVLKALESMKLDAYPEIVKKDVRAWITTLKEERSRKPSGNALSQAKAHILRAKELMDYPQDRAGIVHYIFASRLLHDAIRQKGISPAYQAEAYYQLGLSELVLGTNLFDGEALAFFEETVKLQPKTDLARKAFAQYEELLRFGYSGSGGVNLPAEEKAKIGSLRKLAY